MKLIKAIIQPEKLSDVRDALEKTGSYRGAMISDIMGQGLQKGITQAWRGEKFQTDLLPKVVIDLVVKDADVDAIVETIVKSAHTGEYGRRQDLYYQCRRGDPIRTGETEKKHLTIPDQSLFCLKAAHRIFPVSGFPLGYINRRTEIIPRIALSACTSPTFL
jgi:nitrogen regulatory protein P-II 1